MRTGRSDDSLGFPLAHAHRLDPVDQDDDDSEAVPTLLRSDYLDDSVPAFRVREFDCLGLITQA